MSLNSIVCLNHPEILLEWRYCSTKSGMGLGILCFFVPKDLDQVLANLRVCNSSLICVYNIDEIYLLYFTENDICIYVYMCVCVHISLIYTHIFI